jgi:hypothetical protein
MTNTEIKEYITTLKNSELHELLDDVAHELKISERCIAEGQEDRE